MDNLKEKPILSYDEQIEHLKAKGITFNKEFSENKAKEYLQSHNNLFRLLSYREDFKDNQDKYKGLDFSNLVDLSRIDVKLRRIILCMSLDIEHYSKLQLLDFITQHCLELRKLSDLPYFFGIEKYENKDSRELVRSYRKHLEDESKNNQAKQDAIKRLDKKINDNAKSIHIRGLCKKYREKIDGKYQSFDFPIWAFLEVISFGQFIYFYEFCIKEILNEKKNILGEEFRKCEISLHVIKLLQEEDKSKYEKLIGKAEAELQKSKHRFKTEYKERLREYEKIFYLLHTVRNARNAAAHNNCFLNNLKEQESRSNNINHKVTNALSSIKIKQNQRNKLKNEKINQIITCLYMYKEIVTSKYCEDYKFLKKPYKDVPYELKCQLQEFNKKLEQFNKNIPKEMEYKFNFIQSTFHMIKHVVECELQ